MRVTSSACDDDFLLYNTAGKKDCAICDKESPKQAKKKNSRIIIECAANASTPKLVHRIVMAP
jgi:hypothetical protein